VAWTLEYTATARKRLLKFDPQTRTRIRAFIEERMAVQDDPRSLGKALKGRLSTVWSYRVGDYRIICDIHDEKLVILVVTIGHRREVYR
jgi:mRNA interferase RelE/StbE